MTLSTQFQLNGNTVSLSGADPTESLLRWLRRARLHGTKEGCADGDCGACTVALLETDANGDAHYQAVNSCLLPIGALPGREIVTVEALADGAALHPVQQSMVDCAGSQCGYCTPGFVMSLFAGYYAGELDDGTTEGNLCRCTGYLPIRRATAQLAAQAPTADRFRTRLAAGCGAPSSSALGTYFNPVGIDEAIALKRAHPDAVWIAGGTDLGVALSHGQTVAPAFIALDRLPELKVLQVDTDAVRIGAGVSLSRIETELAGVFPTIDQMLPWFAARQVRNRSTIGGNLGTASPIGDLLPVLLALDAQVHLAGPDGERTLPIDGYFLDYRKTQRNADELIVAVTLPRRASGISAAYKVAKRQTDDISIVAAVFALEFDAQQRVARARLAYGGVAAIPRRARAAEDMLIGRALDRATVDAVCESLANEFTPLSDHRADAAYRRELCANLFAKFVAEYAP